MINYLFLASISDVSFQPSYSMLLVEVSLELMAVEVLEGQCELH
jgi:hypothetical protein